MKTILVEIDVEGGPEAIRNINDLENAISSLEDELKQADFGSEEFKNLSKELTKARSELKNTELALEALDSEQVASEFGSLTGAIGDVSGAFLLLGGEDGTVAQSVEKIQTAIGVSMAFKGAIEGISSGRKLLNNALATSNTLQKINNATTVAAAGIMKFFGKSVKATSASFKGLKAAIIATGIGALVVLIGTLVEYFMSLGDEIDDDTSSMNKFKQELKQANQLMKQTFEATQSIDKTRENAMKMMRSNLDLELAKMKQNGATDAQIQKKKLEFRFAEDAALRASIGLREKELKTAQDVLDTAGDAFMEYNRAYRRDFERYQTALNLGETLEENEQTHYNTLKALKEEVETNVTNSRNQRDSLKQRIIDLKLEQDLLKNKREIEDIDFALQQKIAKEKQKQLKDEKSLKLGKKAELIKIRAAQEIDTIHKVRDVQKLSLEEMNRANMLYYEALDEERKKDAERERAVQNAKLNMTADALGAIGSLANTFAKDTEESQKKAFKINKAVGIAQALIQTYQSAQGAYLSQLSIPTPDAPVRAQIAAGVATAVGLANVAAISAQKFEYSGTSAPSPSGGLGGGIGGTEPQPPAFNVVGQSGFNQVATALGGQQPIKAFVVSQDVTTAQQFDNAIVQTATF